MDYLIQFFLTILIELGTIALFRFKNKYVYLAVIIINLIIHPTTWFLYKYCGNSSFEALLWLEIGIALLEGGILAVIFRKQWTKSLLAGITANYCSFIIGLLLFNYII